MNQRLPRLQLTRSTLLPAAHRSGCGKQRLKSGLPCFGYANVTVCCSTSTLSSPWRRDWRSAEEASPSPIATMRAVYWRFFCCFGGALAILPAAGAEVAPKGQVAVTHTLELPCTHSRSYIYYQLSSGPLPCAAYTPSTHTLASCEATTLASAYRYA